MLTPRVRWMVIQIVTTILNETPKVMLTAELKQKKEVFTLVFKMAFRVHLKSLHLFPVKYPMFFKVLQFSKVSYSKLARK